MCTLLTYVSMLLRMLFLHPLALPNSLPLHILMLYITTITSLGIPVCRYLPYIVIHIYGRYNDTVLLSLTVFEHPFSSLYVILSTYAGSAGCVWFVLVSMPWVTRYFVALIFHGFCFIILPILHGNTLLRGTFRIAIPCSYLIFVLLSPLALQGEIFVSVFQFIIIAWCVWLLSLSLLTKLCIWLFHLMANKFISDSKCLAHIFWIFIS